MYFLEEKKMKIKKFLVQRALPIGLSFSSLFFTNGCSRQSISQNDEVGISIESNTDDTMEEEIHSLEVGQKDERTNNMTEQEAAYFLDDICVLNFKNYESSEEHNYLVTISYDTKYRDFKTAQQLGVSLENKDETTSLLWSLHTVCYNFILNENNTFCTQITTYSNENKDIIRKRFEQSIRIDDYYYRNKYTFFNNKKEYITDSLIFDVNKKQLVSYKQDFTTPFFEVSLSSLKDLYSFEDETITIDTLTKIEQELNENNKLTRKPYL